MRCAACGSEQSESARFCSECGSPIHLQGSLPPAQPAPQTAAWAPSPPPTQTPWSPPATPATDYDALRRISAEQKSFTTPAIITLVLYIVLWVPGLIANIVYLNEASNIQRISGRAPEGKGCLIAMLVVFVGLPVIGFCLFFGIGIIGAASGSN
jgi:hypothetical protein